MKAGLSYAHSVRIGSFLQDVATVVTDFDGVYIKNVCALAQTEEGTVYAAARNGLWQLLQRDASKPRWKSVLAEMPDAPIVRIAAGPNSMLLLGTPARTYLADVRGQNEATLSISAMPHNTISCSLNPASEKRDPSVTLRDFSPLFLTRDELYYGPESKIALPPGSVGTCLGWASDGQVWVGTSQGLLRRHENRWETIGLPRNDSDSPITASPSYEPYVHDVACDVQGGVWVATDCGLFYATCARSLAVTGQEGMPLISTTCLASGSDGALWVGGHSGLAHLSQGSWRYYAGRRWLPSDRVYAILPLDDGSAWIATDEGLACLSFVPMTWERKARHYEQITSARHNRDGYVTECRLTIPGDLNSSLPQASDNDGLWTSLYLAAQCFHYAVTGDSLPRTRARRSLRALLDLVRLTGIDGFPARAIIRRDEKVEQSDPGSNWYESPVDPNIWYKNDTSSDEIDGLYLAWYLYAELVADAEERTEIAAICRAVTHHILNNDYTLVGPTGKATRWGVWSPEKLNHDPAWKAERGLNSLELLSHLKVAAHLCGDARFTDAYQTLIKQHGYALNTVTQKMMPPDAECNHSDDELAACAYYPLLRLESDPALRSLYLWSLERTQAILRHEGSPFYNILYGALTGKPCQAEDAATWLRDVPLDLRSWTMTNSQRPDVALQLERDRFGLQQLRRPLSAREKAIMKWNRNPYLADDGEDGRSEMDGAFWLLPYWMGRYHGILKPSRIR